MEKNNKPINTRQKEILKLISSTKEITVTLLSQTLKISQVTIRKDLNILALNGYVKRQHGSVSITSEDDIANRLLVNFEEKLQIATTASRLINDGDTITIESGSTCALLAKIIAQTKKNVNIVTNSLFISDFIKDYNNVKVIILGGDFQSKSRVTVGPITALGAKQFFTKYMFCGIDGMIKNYGFTVNDYLRASTVRDMATNSQNVYILTESKKFDLKSCAAQLPFETIQGIITDSNISIDIKNFLEKKGIRIITN